MKKKILVSMEYTPPRAHLDEFIDVFDGLYLCVSSKGLDFIYMGDFNYNSVFSVIIFIFKHMILNNLHPLACVKIRVSSILILLLIMFSLVLLIWIIVVRKVGAPWFRLSLVVAQLFCLKKFHTRSKKVMVHVLIKEDLEKNSPRNYGISAVTLC